MNRHGRPCELAIDSVFGESATVKPKELVGLLTEAADSPREQWADVVASQGMARADGLRSGTAEVRRSRSPMVEPGGIHATTRIRSGFG